MVTFNAASNNLREKFRSAQQAVIKLHFSDRAAVFLTDSLSAGCNVVISSRKTERLEAAAQEMRQKIPPSSPASVTPVQCNIRNEDEVGSHPAPECAAGVFICSVCSNGCVSHAAGEASGLIRAETVWQDRLSGEQWRRSV